MNPTVYKAKFKDKQVLRNLLELYQYDFSEIMQYDVNEHGLFDYEYLDNYWTEKGRYPFLIKYDGKIIGFVLVRDILENNNTIHTVAEFFILRKYRNQGFGQKTALSIFKMFGGRWQVAQVEASKEATIFWRKTIGKLTDNGFIEKFDKTTKYFIQEFKMPVLKRRSK